MIGIYIVGAVSVIMISLGVEQLAGSGWGLVAGGVALLGWGFVGMFVAFIESIEKG